MELLACPVAMVELDEDWCELQIEICPIVELDEQHQW
jgi:hypothetical protein